MLCRPHSNMWNHARADRRTIAPDIKWPVKYGQNSAKNTNTSVKMQQHFFLSQYFFFEVKVYAYLGKVRQIQVTGCSSFFLESLPEVWEQYCPPGPLGPDRVNRLCFSLKSARFCFAAAMSLKNLIC